MARAHDEYGRIARKVAARHITRSSGGLTVEIREDFSVRDKELTLATEFDVWMVHAWDDVPESGPIEYIGPDEALRRIAARTEADYSGTHVALRYHHGEPDQGDFALTAIDAYLTGDPDDDENLTSDDPIHMLTIYSKDTLGL